jgi:hypothetical protein
VDTVNCPQRGILEPFTKGGKLAMGLSDDQRDDALKALKGAQEAMEYLMKGVKGLDEANTLRDRIDEVELYLKRAKMALKFI